MRHAVRVLVLCLAAGWITVFAQRITESLAGWTLGTNIPEIGEGQRGDGTTGKYIHMLVGTSPMYYEVQNEGEGLVEFWIYDPGKCLESVDPGYGINGPHWGLQTLLYQYGAVGIGRADYISGCLGYSPWSSVDPYSHWWWFDGARGSHGQPFTPGWYKWSVAGTWDNISFTQYDIYFQGPLGGGPDPAFHQGDAVGTIDATTFGGSWTALFGDGWKAFWLKGDEASGIEDIFVDVPGGCGIFSEFGPITVPCPFVEVARPYVESSWGDIKSLFR